VKMEIDLVYLTMCDSIVNMWIFVSVLVMPLRAEALSSRSHDPCSRYRDNPAEDR
jgi:hypothetical protein